MIKKKTKKTPRKVVKPPVRSKAVKPKIIKKAVKVTVIKNVKIKKLKPKKVKVVKEKIYKKPRRPAVVCILTGQTFKISQLQLEKQALRLKFPNVQEYVQYYVCKEARIMLKDGFTDIEIRSKFNCKDRTDFPVRILKCYAKKVKDRERAKRRARKKALNEFINDTTPGKYILKPKGDPVFLDMKKPEDVKALTSFSCARPHIYLNNDRRCDGCNIFKLCCCTLKRLKK